MNEKEIDDMEKRIDMLWVRMREKDMEAAQLLEEKDLLLEDFRPLETALLVNTEKLVRMSLEKETMLREVWKASKILISLEAEEDHTVIYT